MMADIDNEFAEIDNLLGEINFDKDDFIANNAPTD
jgi:hypothetical protein